MAAILQHQPLTIRQQVEELKNWHKQQQNKVDFKTNKDNCKNKTNGNRNISDNKSQSQDTSSNTMINFDEIPIKVSNSNLKTFIENNVAPVDSDPSIETKKIGRPKFKFLKKGEGIARFNMGPPTIAKKPLFNRNNRKLRLNKDGGENDAVSRDHRSLIEVKNVESGVKEDVSTLKAPDLKLNFTWKNILSGENPEAMLEKVIKSNHLEMMDPNSSIDSSTASLMEKLLAIGKNRLSRDREELRVFEAVEQHMLDSSFCSTSTYVNKLMENAVISTPEKGKFEKERERGRSVTTKNSDQLPTHIVPGENNSNNEERILEHALPTSAYLMRGNATNTDEERFHNEDGMVMKTSNVIATWTKPTTNMEESDTSVEISLEDLGESLHVKFADEVDYKSFVERSESNDNESLSQGKISSFDESHEWNEESNSCCSQCSNHSSLADERNPSECQIVTNKFNSHNEKPLLPESGDVFSCDNRDLNGIPPHLSSKLKELEDEIKTFQQENKNIKTLRETLEKERKQILEEKRRLNLEKKKLQKDIEEQKNALKTQFEEERQKLSKEKIIFEKYSKSLTKNPTREERKEIQILREQLSEIKEELNKKESRWGAAQARVRNQVKVLEEDNKKLRAEIEDFRKQAKYWDLFQKKKGKPFNNTKLIHAISEHISNIVLDDANAPDKIGVNKVRSQEKSSASNVNTQLASANISSMYGVKLKEGSVKTGSPSDKIATTSNYKSENKCESNGAALSTVGFKDSLQLVSESNGRNWKTLSNEHAEESNERTEQNEDGLQKSLDVPNVIVKEVIDGSGNVEITYPNGNVKKINKITGSEKYIYVNGDVEEITHDGTIKYYFSESRIWHTTLPDGLEIVDFPDGKIEKRHVDGTVEIVYSNNNKKITFPDGSQEILYSDGTRLRVDADKTQILTLPNGQKEIHTQEWKRREYPDGTMKTLYPDGTTETVYSNGRVRLKDKYGNLVMDSVSTMTGPL